MCVKIGVLLLLFVMLIESIVVFVLFFFVFFVKIVKLYYGIVFWFSFLVVIKDVFCLSGWCLSLKVLLIFFVVNIDCN